VGGTDAGCGPIIADRSGPIPLEQIDDAIDAALKAGIVDFDTAPLYGDSEDRLGHALANSSLGDQAQVYTKAGKLIRRICGNKQIALLGPQPWSGFAVPLEERCLLPDYSAAGARLSCQESCERLGIEKLHTLRIHDPDSIEGVWDQAVAADGLIAGLRQVRYQGDLRRLCTTCYPLFEPPWSETVEMCRRPPPAQG